MAATASPDIVPKLAKFLDKHLVFPLLEFLSSKEVCCLTGELIEKHHS